MFNERMQKLEAARARLRQEVRPGAAAEGGRDWSEGEATRELRFAMFALPTSVNSRIYSRDWRGRTSVPS